MKTLTILYVRSRKFHAKIGFLKVFKGFSYKRVFFSTDSFFPPIVFFPPVRPVDFPFYPPVKSLKTKNPPVIWSHVKNQCVLRWMFASDLPLITCSEPLSESWSIHGNCYIYIIPSAGLEITVPFSSCMHGLFYQKLCLLKKSTVLVHFENSTGRQKQKKTMVSGNSGLSCQ